MKTKVAIFSVGFPVCSSRTLSGRPHYISAEYPHCFFQKLRRTTSRRVRRHTLHGKASSGQFHLDALPQGPE